MEEDVIRQCNDILKEVDAFTVDSIMNVNQKPHPYAISPKHLERNDSVYLGEEQINKMEDKYGPMCAHPGCKLRYTDHTTGDKVALIKLSRSIDKKTALDEMTKIQTILDNNKVDGIALLETPEKFRVE